jgi:hypothetical protein
MAPIEEFNPSSVIYIKKVVVRYSDDIINDIILYKLNS